MNIFENYFTSIPITDENRASVIEWLNERKQFHIWFTSLILGCFVVLTIFGSKPSFNNLSESTLSISLILQLFSAICNMICIWSIPDWKFGVATNKINNTKRIRIELGILAWVGVISFVCGLTFGFVGNISI